MFFIRRGSNSESQWPWPQENKGRLLMQEAWEANPEGKFIHYVSFDGGDTWYDMFKLVEMIEQGSLESARASDQQEQSLISEFRRDASRPNTGM